MKRNFFTGLILLCPLAITLFVVMFVVNFFTKPFLDFFKVFLLDLGFIEQNGKFFFGYFPLVLVSKFLILLSLIAITVVVGFLAQLFFMRVLIRWADAILHRVPVVNRIYKAAQEVVRKVFIKDEQKFSQVVLVPFPDDQSQSIAFVTGDGALAKTKEENRSFVSVFLPGTPNPTNGFLLSFPSDQVVLLDMTVEEAIRAVISCGVTINGMVEQKASASGGSP